MSESPKGREQLDQVRPVPVKREVGDVQVGVDSLARLQLHAHLGQRLGGWLRAGEWGGMQLG